MELGQKCTQSCAASQQTAGRGTTGPSRALPIPAGAGRAGLTAPHRTGPLYSQLHLPAMTRTLKGGGKFASVRSRRGAPFSVSEVISNSSADVGSALRCCRRCVCALVLCPVRVPYSSVGTRIIQLFGKVCLLESAQHSRRGDF